MVASMKQIFYRDSVKLITKIGVNWCNSVIIKFTLIIFGDGNSNESVFLLDKIINYKIILNDLS